METKVTKEELLAKAKKPAADAMKMHPYYQGENRDRAQVRDKGHQRFLHLVHAGRSRAVQGDTAEPGSRLRNDEQGEHGRHRHGRHAGARSGRHRPHGGPAGHGGQGPAVQIPGRRRCLPDLPGYERPRRVHQDGQVPLPDVRRDQPGRHRKPEMLLYPRAAARRGAHPRMARRPAGHGGRDASRV